MQLINNKLFDPTRRWPGIELPKMTRGIKIFSYCLGVFSIAYGFYTFTHEPHAEKFIALALIPLVLFLFRSPLAFLSFLITGVVITAFLTIGNPEDIAKFIFISIVAVFIFVDLNYSYLIGIMSLYIFVIPSYQGFTIAHAAFLLIMIAFITTKIGKRDFPIFRRTGLTKYLSLFYAWAFFSMLWCQQISTGLYDLFEYFILFSIFLVSVSLIKDKKQLITIAWTWVIMAFLYSLIKPFYSPTETSSMAGGASAATGLFSAKNTISSLINLSLFMLISLYATDKRLFQRLFLIFATTCMLTVNIIFGSKGGLLSFGIGLLLYLFFVNIKEKKWRRWLLKLVNVAIIAALIIVIPLVPLVMFSIGEIFPFDLSDASFGFSLEFRFDQWGIASQMLEDNSYHLIGLGLGGYKALYTDYLNVDISDRTFDIMLYAHPHSYWVYTYTDMGIIGMVLLHIFFILYVVRMQGFILNVRDRTLKIFGTALFFGVVSYWIHGIVDFGYNEANRMWLFIGTGLAITYMKDEGENPIKSTEQ